MSKQGGKKTLAPRLEVYPLDAQSDEGLYSVDIVLVHGLDGDLVETWQASDSSKVFWPRDFLPNYLPDARVLSFGYNASIRGTTSDAKIRGHAASLLYLLRDKRNGIARLRPLIFIGHSLGGAIIKQALLLASHNERIQSIADSTYGVMFFATPHYGQACSDKWKHFAESVLRSSHDASGFGPAPKIPNGMLKQIQDNAVILGKITDDFELLLKHKPEHELIGLVNYLEESRVKAMGDLAIDQPTGRLASADISVYLAGNHLGLCKFGEEDRELFDKVGKALKGLAQESPKANYNKLWIHGYPACGKTFLAYFIVGHLRESKSEQAEVMYCFLDARVEAGRDRDAILRQTLHQATRIDPALISNCLYNVYRKSKTRTLTIDVLCRLWPEVMALLAKRKRLMIVIDGFDEIDDKYQEEFLGCFNESEKLCREKRLNLRLLILSRCCPSLDRHKQSFRTYEIAIDDTARDISVTVSKSVERLSRITGFPKFFQKMVIEGISEGARGTYLWATVLLADIEITLPSLCELNKRLKTLPREMAELYDSILGRMDSRVVKLILRWVNFQYKALSIQELDIGLAMAKIWDKDPGSSINDPPLQSDTIDTRDVKLALHGMCGQLIRFSRAESGNEIEVLPVHRSLTLYLATPTRRLREQHRDPINIPHHDKFFMAETESHATLGNLCVAYLTMPRFADPGKRFQADGKGPKDWECKVRKRMENDEFAGYAALFWSKHLEKAGPDISKHSSPLDLERRKMLRDKESGYARCWFEMWWLCKEKPIKEFPVEEPKMDEIIGPELSEIQQPGESYWGGFLKLLLSSMLR
ncbi:hypothetical protein DL767_004069 [Monosporascus sp. MG133]|nr:hypothetical protein DL767_004069 [Monosporascus sp. MG133]